MNNNQLNETKPYSVLRWMVSFALLIVTALLQLLASNYPQLVETYYSRRLYPYIGQSLSFFNKLFSFSLAESLFLLLATSLPIWLFWQIRHIYLQRLTRKNFVLNTLWYFFTFINIGLLTFLLIWGLNYQKQPLGKNLNLTPYKVDPTELIRVCQYFINATNQSYLEANPPTLYLTNSNNTTNDINTANDISKSNNLDWVSLNSSIEDSFQKEPLLKPLTFGNYAPAKAVYFSKAMSYLGISGIYIPLTGEANVNVAQPSSTIPFTLAHEKAHQRGFAREDEANFIAFLISTKSQNPYCRYSGYLITTIHLLNSLALIAPEQYQTLYKSLSYGPRSDLKAISQFWAYYEGRLSKVSEKVNNSYLKANQVRSGVENYNEVVELVISYCFTYLLSKDSDTLNFPVGNKL